MERTDKIRKLIQRMHARRGDNIADKVVSDIDPETGETRAYVQEGKESVEESYNSSMEYGSPRRSRSQPSVMSPDTQNIDDLDVRPSAELDDPNTFARVNMYVQRAAGTTADPWRIIRNVHYKLHISGINFDLPHGELELPEEDTTYVFDLSFHGGQYGPKPDGEWTDDDGYDGVYVLLVHIDPVENGMWDLQVELARADELEEELEDADSFNEGSQCDCNHDDDADSLENIQERLSPYAEELSSPSEFLHYEIIDGNKSYWNEISKINSLMLNKVKRGKYVRKKAIKFYKDAIYKIYKKEMDYIEDEIGSISARTLLELAAFYADTFEEKIEKGEYGDEFKGTFASAY